MVIYFEKLVKVSYDASDVGNGPVPIKSTICISATLLKHTIEENC